jgi:cation diffusion facilitator family transporter
MHQISGVRDPGATFTLVSTVDEAGDRRQANLAVGWGGAGLAVTGLIELVLALLSGSVALLGDALHNVSDVSTSVLVFVGFRASKRASTKRYSYGYERAEDLAGVGIAIVIWASAVFAGVESIRKLLGNGGTHLVGWAIAGATVGIIGNLAWLGILLGVASVVLIGADLPALGLWLLLTCITMLIRASSSAAAIATNHEPATV